MKQIIFITCLMVSMLAKGQEYQSFCDTIKQWNTLITSYTYGGSPAIKTTLKHHISSKDTIINDTLYLLVVNTGAINEAFPQITGFIREEVSEKKVYFRENSYEFNVPKDRLLYDFSLGVGDTTEIFGLHHCESFSNIFKVVSTDKIILLNDEERKVWHLESIGENANEPDIWIEGIGSLNGLLFPGCYQIATLSFSLNLLCYYEEGINLYVSDEGSCEVDWSSGMKTDVECMVKVFPNPAKEKITINLPNDLNSCSSYQIVSLNGIKVSEGSFCNTSVTITTKSLKPGMYYLKIYNKSTQTVSKFIINN
jgi:hypothetical protein